MTVRDTGGDVWPADLINAVADVLASTDKPGLSTAEIDRLLLELGVPFVDASNKRGRLAASLLAGQVRDGSGAVVDRFITRAMAPARYLRDQKRFHELQSQLNEPLALAGLRVTAAGRLERMASTATTLDEVARLAGRLRTELVRRGVHDEVPKYCDEELLRRSLFHAVFEATKGLSQRLRMMTGLTEDGAKLVDVCFALSAGLALVRINDLGSESETSEHKGFANLLRGIFGTFRNPPAHTARAAGTWDLTEADALDAFTMLSFVHRRLDQARVTPRP